MQNVHNNVNAHAGKRRLPKGIILIEEDFQAKYNEDFKINLKESSKRIDNPLQKKFHFTEALSQQNYT